MSRIQVVHALQAGLRGPLALDIADAAARRSLRSNAKLRLGRDVQGWVDSGNWLRLQVRSSDGKAVFDRRKDDGAISRLQTAASGLNLSSGTWYDAKVVVDDDPALIGAPQIKA